MKAPAKVRPKAKLYLPNLAGDQSHVQKDQDPEQMPELNKPPTEGAGSSPPKSRSADTPFNKEKAEERHFCVLRNPQGGPRHRDLADRW